MSAAETSWNVSHAAPKNRTTVEQASWGVERLMIIAEAASARCHCQCSDPQRLSSARRLTTRRRCRRQKACCRSCHACCSVAMSRRRSLCKWLQRIESQGNSSEHSNREECCDRQKELNWEGGSRHGSQPDN